MVVPVPLCEHDFEGKEWTPEGAKYVKNTPPPTVGYCLIQQVSSQLATELIEIWLLVSWRPLYSLVNMDSEHYIRGSLRGLVRRYKPDGHTLSA